MSNFAPRNTFRSKYISLVAAALLAVSAVGLAVSPNRSAEAVSADRSSQVNDSGATSPTVLKNNFIEPLTFVNPLLVDVMAAWSFDGVTVAGTAGQTPTVT